MNVDVVEILIEIAIFIMGLYIIFFKSYFKKKGENLATKEDIAIITEKVELVKTHLNVIQKKNEIILIEKINVFKKIQDCLNDFRDYLEARVGDYSSNEFHPNTNTIPKEINTSCLDYITRLHYLERRNFIFIDKASRDALRGFVEEANTLLNIELTLPDEESEEDDEITKIAPAYYSMMKEEVENVLTILYRSLNDINVNS